MNGSTTPDPSEETISRMTKPRDKSATGALMRFYAMQFEKVAIVVAVTLAALAYALRDRLSQPALLMWASLVVPITLWRYLLSRKVREKVTYASPTQIRRYELLVLISTSLGSFVMGSGFWFVALHGDLYVKLIMTMFSMIHLLAVLIYATPDISHRVIRVVGNVGQGILFWLGVGSDNVPHWEMLAAYCGLSWGGLLFAQQHLRLLHESLHIRDENAALLLKLEEDKKFIESALREAKLANESKSRFLAAASHDLRQPLHALTMFLGTMTFHVTTDDAKRLLGRIKDTVQVLEEQFDSLLDLSRFDVGAIAAEVKLFRLDINIERLLDEMRPIAEVKKLEIKLDIRDIAGPVVAKTDPNLIGRLLRNLLDNAIKYTTSGSVVIRVTGQEKTFLVEVVDTGPGIPDEQQKRIFDEYVQLTNPARQRRHGVGLGLAIVKRIDALLGLSLALKSTVGKGSSFSILVPAANDETNVQVPHSASTTVSKSADFKTLDSIWILDDDPIALEGLQSQLSVWGATVKTFTRAEDLLIELRAGTSLPHWICTDDMLGESLSGLETAQILSSEFGFVKICIVTGNTEPSRLKELRSSGFPVIVKPAKPDELMAIICS
jgi:two-component system, sensor histidine kinase